ncbi:DUF2787 family protein [Ferrimonas sp. SCSIO 43195]|uniref:DUF2787 family protein n=1 Tax=Ferrimonas sp. SCSIO 43195 TaxID=2822844 RepID=UPI002074BF27|nr:DUF2787 family protein [Ferrimonas sp. SCSIO 43195]USD35982.1 DUF2787 domain-containing protein [Ferrimonas sp. SCSIO 43195]
MTQIAHIDTTGLPFRLKLSLLRQLEFHLAEVLRTWPSSTSLTLNYRDPSYSSATGGYHPVEIRLERYGAKGSWRLCYITDFAYFGDGPHVELAKELDFDFTSGVGYQAYAGEHPIRRCLQLFRLWEANFLHYLSNGVYQMQSSIDCPHQN